MSPLYVWQRFFENAVLETDRRRLPVLIRAAQAAIQARMEQLKLDYRPPAEELQALEDAMAGLHVLKREAGTN